MGLGKERKKEGGRGQGAEDNEDDNERETGPVKNEKW